MADVVVTNDVDTFLRSADNAAARTNLEVYSDAEVDAKVATKAVAGGVQLDGLTTSYVEIPATSIGNIFTNEGSFSFYAKIDDISLNHTIFDCRNGSGVGGFGIFYRDDQKIRLVHETSGTILIGEATTTINEGEWFHCVITHDGTVDSSAPIFFINGVQLVTSAVTTASGTIGTVPPSVGRFGEVVTGSSAPLLGSIKNALFFNRALSAAEVADLYESGTVAVADRWGNPTPIAPVSIFTTSITDNGGTTTSFDFTSTGSSGIYKLRGAPLSLIVGEKYRISGSVTTLPATGTLDIYLATSTGLTASNIVSLTSTGAFAAEFTATTASSGTSGFDIRLLNGSGSTTVGTFTGIEPLGCIADLPLDEGIGYQFHDRSSNHYDGLASTSGVTHLVPKTEGYIRDFNVDAYNGGSGNVELVSSTQDIIPEDVGLLSLAVRVNGALAVSQITGKVSTRSARIDNVSSTVSLSNSNKIVLTGLGRKPATYNNYAVSSTDSDATDLNFRVDYKVIER